VEQGQHFLATHFAKRNTKNCGGEKRSDESEGGKVFVSATRITAIKIRSPNFSQKRFAQMLK